MKNLPLIIFVLIFLQTTASSQTSQPCLPEGITFSTQNQIDSFQINYPNCTEIEGSVLIFGQDKIVNLDGLSSVTSIVGDLNISDNYFLPSLSGFHNLASIHGKLSIQGNTSLKSLSGLNNIDPASIMDLQIIGNDSLSICAIESICEYLYHPTGIFVIYGNADGCNNPGEINEACEAIGLPDIYFKAEFSIYPNPAKDVMTISTNNGAIIEEVIIYNQIGHKVLHHKPVNQPIDVSMLRQGMYVIEVVCGNRRIIGKFIK